MEYSFLWTNFLHKKMSVSYTSVKSTSNPEWLKRILSSRVGQVNNSLIFVCKQLTMNTVGLGMVSQVTFVTKRAGYIIL